MEFRFQWQQLLLTLQQLAALDLALERRATVLRRMREAGFIDDLQLQRASATPLELKPAEPKYWTSRAPYFTSWVAQELPKVLSPEQLEVGGLTIRTSLNMPWQERAQATINKHAPGEMQGAVVSMEPGTGLVRSMVGGKDFASSQFNRAAQALRSPGSTFKLFVYLTALDPGAGDRFLEAEGAERGTGGGVESAAIGPANRGTGGGNDDCVT